MKSRWAAVVFASSLFGGPARAEPPEALAVRLRVEEDLVLAEFEIESAFSADFRRRVEGGLESRVEIETELLDRTGSTIGRGARSCKLLYSLWDEEVYVAVEDQGRSSPRLEVHRRVDDALSACGRATGLPVGLAATLALRDGYVLEVRVALNPVSEELVRRSRQFIANPRGGSRGRSSTVLGAVAGLFGPGGGAPFDVSVHRSPPLPRPSARRPLAPSAERKPVGPDEKYMPETATSAEGPGP